jgi:hypothetical protein
MNACKRIAATLAMLAAAATLSLATAGTASALYVDSAIYDNNGTALGVSAYAEPWAWVQL